MIIFLSIYIVHCKQYKKYTHLPKMYFKIGNVFSSSTSCNTFRFVKVKIKYIFNMKIIFPKYMLRNISVQKTVLTFEIFLH